MSSVSKPGFIAVARRECAWLFRDRVALLLIFGVPLFAFVVLTAVFSHPVIRHLGVTVVDEDRSDASRALVEYISASPSLQIVGRSGTLSAYVSFDRKPTKPRAATSRMAKRPIIVAGNGRRVASNDAFGDLSL